MGENYSQREEVPTEEGTEIVPVWKGGRYLRTTIQKIAVFTRALSSALTAAWIDFTTGSGNTSFPQGRLGWDDLEHTYTGGLEFGSKLQLGMEIIRYNHNISGLVIPNGKFVFFGVNTPDGHTSIGLVDASLNARHAGLTTSEFANDGHGYVVKDGIAHDVDITGLTIDLPIYADPLSPGDLTNTQPEWPDEIIFVGAVIKDNGDNTGDIDVSPYIVQREVPTPSPFETYSAIPARNAVENIHGGLVSLVTGHDLDATDLTMPAATPGSPGIGKLIIVVNAGADAVGEISVTGTKRDRATGVKTAIFVDTIPINGLSTDASSTDANGIEHHDIVDGYITSVWFDGSDADVVISSSDTTLTDIDIYQCSFEQYNQAKVILLNAFDVNLFCFNSSAASLSAYLYTVIVVESKVTIQTVADIVESVFTAGSPSRHKREGLGIQLDGRMDGIFVEVAYLGTPSKFRDASLKVWSDVIT